MEEFDNKNSPALNDDVILAAEKRVTLQPIHTDVHVDDENDIRIAASHANGAPIGNISSDRESTIIDENQAATNKPAPLPKQSASATTPKRHMPYKAIAAMVLVIAILLFALLYR